VYETPRQPRHTPVTAALQLLTDWQAALAFAVKSDLPCFKQMGPDRVFIVRKPCFDGHPLRTFELLCRMYIEGEGEKPVPEGEGEGRGGGGVGVGLGLGEGPHESNFAFIDLPSLPVSPQYFPL